MAFCASCGAPVEGKFCAKCGAPMGAAVPPPGAAPGVAAAGMTDNAASALCYVLGLITGILFLVLAPYNQNKTIRFHAFQSIFLSIALDRGLDGDQHCFQRIAYVEPVVSVSADRAGVLHPVDLHDHHGIPGEEGVLPVIGPIAQGQA